MITLLARLFIKNSENIDDPSVRRAYGTLSGVTGIILNIFLFIIKFFAGTISGAISITADAFNNLSDAGSSIITLLGFKMAGKAADADHPFGHGRYEYISGLIVSGAIIIMGFELAKSSVQKIINPSAVVAGNLAIAILCISICVKLYMFLYNRGIGKRINSSGMAATAIDSLSDAIATTVVLLSAIFMRVTGIVIDGYCGVVVSLCILYAGYSAAKDTLRPLLGQAPDPELVRQIEAKVLAHKEIIGIHDLIVHDYGPGRLIISLHGEVPGNGDIYKLHDIIDLVEHELRRDLNCEAVIHMDPIDTDDKKVNDMRSAVSSIVKMTDDSLTIHDFRMVSGPTHTNLIFDVVVPYGFRMKNDELKAQISHMVSSRYPDYYCVIDIDNTYAM